MRIRSFLRVARLQSSRGNVLHGQRRVASSTTARRKTEMRTDKKPEVPLPNFGVYTSQRVHELVGTRDAQSSNADNLLGFTPFCNW